MDEGQPSQQPRAGVPSPGIAYRSSADDVIQEEEEASGNEGARDEEKEKALANDGIHVEEKESANDGVHEEEKEKAPANDGVQEEKKEEALKTDLPASCPESNPPAGKKKKPHPVRVWSDEDEVRILECLVAYVKDHAEPPGRAKLPDVVIGLDKKEFTLTEIYEKVRRLRDHYHRMRRKADAGAPPRAEDLGKYELSREIWGDSLPVTPKRETKQNGSGSGRQAPAEPRVRREFEELRRMYPQLAFMVEQIAAGDRACLKRAFQFIDDSKARELDAKVKKLRIAEMEIEADRSSSRREVLRMLLKCMES